MTPTSTDSPAPVTGFFAGSFNPFTVGHADIVERALRVFGRVVIGIGVNAAKPADADAAEARAERLRALYAADSRVEVEVYSGLTVNAAAAAGAAALIRSVRSVKDYEYERDLADINMKLTGIDSVIYFSRPELAAISSSVVRELASYGVDTSSFLPNPTQPQ